MKFLSSLRVAVLPFNGLFEVEELSNGRMAITGGLEKEYIEILSKSLNFQMQILAPEDGEWGIETTNGTWTGLVGMVLGNESDIALGGIAVTEKRNRVIHYSAPYRFTYLTFATNLPPELPRFTTFLYPFTLKLWIALAVLLMAMPFVFRLLLKQKASLSKYFLATIKCLLYETLSIKQNGATRDYFLLGAWLLGSMLISYSYAATLLSFLTIPLSEPGVQNVKHLSELVAEGKFRSGAFKGTNVVNILKASQHKSIVALGDHIQTNKYDIEPEKEVVEKFYKSKNSALLAPEIYFRMNFPNTLRLSPEPVKCTAISMVMSKAFCCKQELDRHINRMFNSGLSQQIVKRVLTRIEIKNSLNKPPDAAQDLTLNVEDFVGAFALITIGIILSVFALIFEILISKFRKKK